MKIRTFAMFLWLFTTCSCGDTPYDADVGVKLQDPVVDAGYVHTGVASYGAAASGGVGPIFVQPPTDNCADAECDSPDDWYSYDDEDPLPATSLLAPPRTDFVKGETDELERSPAQTAEQQHPNEMEHE